jgi:hypothetical protein
MTDAEQVVDPRAEAGDRVGGRFDVRVLEPAPPAVAQPPWFADDPVLDSAASGRPVVAPVPVPGATTWDDLARTEPDLAPWCADRWLGAWRRLEVPADRDALARTRGSWHILAEQVLAPARRHANGKIGLRFTRGGFGTTFFGADEQMRIAVEGLIVVREGELTSHPITTVAAAARVVGIEPGAPADLYTPTTVFAPEAPLEVDALSARFLGDWFGFGASVIEEWRAAATAEDAPERVQLWPEHFDLSVDLGAEAAGARGTYGASPGDDAHPAPYLYVTPWATPSGAFWNEGAFASLSLEAFADATDQRAAALDFFAQARSHLTA